MRFLLGRGHHSLSVRNLWGKKIDFGYSMLESNKEVAIMPYATMCPKCSNHWTLNEASPRSWSCPECHTLLTGSAQDAWCTCGHAYRKHETRRSVDNSLSAMTLRGDAAMSVAIKRMSLAAASPDPPIGCCSKCVCREYRNSS